jgi:hypothetical protein
MKKRLMAGLAMAGLMAAMLPGMASAETPCAAYAAAFIGPDVQKYGAPAAGPNQPLPWSHVPEGKPNTAGQWVRGFCSLGT